jgi:hypothetical protein
MPDIKSHFDRSNTSSGKPHQAPDVKASGVSTVARVMTRAERPQPTSTGHGIRFEAEDTNHAHHVKRGGYAGTD